MAGEVRSANPNDPTANVIKLVEKEAEMRKMSLAYVEKIADLRAIHIDRIADLRANHNTDLRKAETERLDAIHAADVAASERLATQVETTAATMRVTVEQQRISTAEGLQQALDPINKSLAELTRALYAGEGGSMARREGKSDTQFGKERFQAWLALIAFMFIGIISFLAATGHLH